MNKEDKALRDRLARAEGQLRGVARMLEEGRGCEDVVTQLLAARSAIDRIAAEIVAAHIDECMAKLPREEARATVGQAIKILGRLQ